MNRQEYFDLIKSQYDLVKLLSDKNGSKSYVLRNRQLGQNLVLHLFETPVEVYSFLKTVSFVNLPTIHDCIALDDGQAVLEEFIDGLSVSEVLESGLYTYSGARRIICDLCDALSVIHSNGFVHRDIKPENVMITKDGTVKLIDFNASRKTKPNVQKDTVAIGTLGYASPEQLGLSQSDPRTDVYALGVLLNVMLTGEHPSRQMAKGRAGKIILHCTQINPDERYRTVKELKKDM